MAESVLGKPIDTAVKELSDKIGTVPSGKTVEGQIDALNSNTPQYISQGVSVGASYSIDIEDGKAYLITLMTSSNNSQQTYMITRRGSDIQKSVLFSGGYNQYFTDSISNNKWTVTISGYFSTINIIIF